MFRHADSAPGGPDQPQGYRHDLPTMVNLWSAKRTISPPSGNSRMGFAKILVGAEEAMALFPSVQLAQGYGQTEAAPATILEPRFHVKPKSRHPLLQPSTASIRSPLSI